MDADRFDSWSHTYDDDVRASTGRYPFDGYDEVLNLVESLVTITGSATVVLDIGVGTGAVSRRLYEKGAAVLGIDFSEKMLKKAREAMPGARFFAADIREGLPGEIADTTFNYILSAYTFHHFADGEKISLVESLLSRLARNGAIVAADIIFATRDDLVRCRKEAGDEWDEGEHYIVLDEFRTRLERLGVGHCYRRVSSCAGVLTITGR